MGVFWFNLYYWPLFLLVTALGVVVCPLLFLVDQLRGRQRTPAATLRHLIRLYGWLLVVAVPFWQPVRLVNKGAKLPVPVIFVPNHTSAIDPFVFGALAMENAFVTSWPFKIPGYSFFMRQAGYVDVRKGWPEVARGVEKLLGQGCSVIMWPEGHRTRTGKMGRFRRGAFEVAVRSNTPIVPVCIKGTRRVLPAGKIFLRPGRVTLTLLPPVYPQKGLPLQEQVASLRDTVRTMIAEELARSA
ncbi:MAG: lysophospholipid acyltransferase family protein [Desulfurivibrionaceae bacterium]|nr:lysophospholipid acyltransferase family protein [Desulfurivibrionaceae bacterium]